MYSLKSGSVKRLWRAGTLAAAGRTLPSHIRRRRIRQIREDGTSRAFHHTPANLAGPLRFPSITPSPSHRVVTRAGAPLTAGDPTVRILAKRPDSRLGPDLCLRWLADGPLAPHEPSVFRRFRHTEPGIGLGSPGSKFPTGPILNRRSHRLTAAPSRSRLRGPPPIPIREWTSTLLDGLPACRELSSPVRFTPREVPRMDRIPEAGKVFPPAECSRVMRAPIPALIGRPSPSST